MDIPWFVSWREAETGTESVPRSITYTSQAGRSVCRPAQDAYANRRPSGENATPLCHAGALACVSARGVPPDTGITETPAPAAATSRDAATQRPSGDHAIGVLSGPEAFTRKSLSL